jgi:DNA repair protein SbcC/Rad50
VRPLRLSIAGLRSYRSRCQIDFTDARLIAIVGDTGAGKSSILEAITYALYNATTWPGRAKELISDGAATMSVEFDFSAEGKDYRVHRSTSRGSYPPPVHKLECLSDPKIPKRDGEREVQAEIERLLGLDKKAFLSAVLLPQGEFQNLLEATEGDRSRILKGILKLDTIDRAREEAQTLCDQVVPLVEALQLARLKLLDDPAGVLEESAGRMKHAEAEERRLTRLGREIRTLEEEAARLAGAARDLELPAERLGSIPRGAAARLKELVPEERKIAERMTELLARKETIEVALSECVGVLNGLASAGESIESLLRARSVLDQAARDLAERCEAVEKEVAEEEAAGRDEETELAKIAKIVARLRRDREAAEARQEELEARARRFIEDLNDARNLLQAWRSAGREIAALEQDLAARRRELKKLEGQAKTAARLENEARSAAERTRDELELKRRTDAAAHAAHGLASGDDCPVCRRPIPRGFEPPTAPDLEEARKSAEGAQEHLAAARDRHAAAKIELETIRRSIENEEKRVSALEKDSAERWTALLGKLPDASREATDEAILAPIVRRGSDLERDLEEARTSLKTARGEETTKDADLRTRRDNLERDRQRREKRRLEVARVRNDCRKSLATLPAFIRPAGDLASAAVPPLLEDLDAKLEAVRSRVAERDRLQSELRSLSDEQDGWSRRKDLTIGTPRREALDLLRGLFTRLNDGLESLGRDAMSAPPAARTLEEEALWGSELEALRDDVVAALAAARDEALANAEERRVSVRTRIAEHCFRDDEERKSALVLASAEKRNAELDRARAEKELPVADDLDRRLVRGRELLDAMKELRELLADGKFVGHVRERRQKNLLAVASETLGSMTGGRYGFSPAFEVVDRMTNQPRSTRTLSGGESFLASLALALGLVENAGRSGGRLDALFLDEGFGALDANSLDEALTALENRATGGRLVAVVSHLKAVAERIEKVMLVKRTPTGSVAVWADPSDREEILTSELETSLLS